LSTEIPISVNSWGPTSVVRFGAALLINPSQPLMRSWCGHPSGWDLDHLSKFGGCKDMKDLRYCWEMNRNGIFHVVELLINYIYIIIHVYQDDTSRFKITHIYICMYVWMDGCMHACMHACMYVCMYIHTHIIHTLYTHYTHEIHHHLDIWHIIHSIKVLYHLSLISIWHMIMGQNLWNYHMHGGIGLF
jgi:hypothetical protein